MKSILGHEHQIEPHPCPNCGAKLDGATSVGHDRAPRVDRTLTICIYCSQMLILRAHGFEKISLKLYSSLPPQQRRLLMRLAQVATQVRNQRKARN